MSPQIARRPGVLLACLVTAALSTMPACGGGSTSPTTTPPTPPPPQVVVGGNFTLAVNFATGGFFTTDRAGTIVATVDYTFPTSQILVWIARGECTSEQFEADTCTYVATSFAGGDPRTVTVTGAAAGRYTLIVFNGGPDDEAFNVQVVLTPSAAAASSDAAVVTPVPGSWLGQHTLRR